MCVAQVRNAEHLFLATSDLLQAADKNFMFEAYANTINNFTSVEVQPFDTVRLNTAPEMFDFTSSILTISRAGIYLFNIRATFQSSGSADAEAIMYLEQDPDTGVFATVTGAVNYIAMPALMRSTSQISVPLQVGFDYRYRVSVQRTVGSDTISTLANTPTLSCLCLFQNQ